MGQSRQLEVEAHSGPAQDKFPNEALHQAPLALLPIPNYLTHILGMLRVHPLQPRPKRSTQPLTTPTTLLSRPSLLQLHFAQPRQTTQSQPQEKKFPDKGMSQDFFCSLS